ncbi:MAG: hypothetical protein OEZ68_13265 [Gammaproteobacteria bacterium]|nr:hypothetical protein [Gammaproteobacteria bacterium]MDH5801769.1 hypothetical protein [Gammaproteobacteria bacterium]
MVISKKLRYQRYSLQAAMILLLLSLPVSMVFATGPIADSVAAFCVPSATVPPVSSCSSCHSTTANRGVNDLTAAGRWALSQATFSNFCPGNTNTPPPSPTPTPTPTPNPGTGMGMGSTGGSIGMGIGGDDDDDDDDGEREAEEDDDDDDGVSSLINRIRGLGQRNSRSFGRR